MAVRIEKDGPVWTVIHDRPEARNAMDPESADALTEAFLQFDADDNASVAVFYGAGGAFCAGWDLKFVSTLDLNYPLGELDIPPAKTRGNGGDIPRGPLGPSRLELDKPVIAAVAGPAVAGGMELALWCDFRVMQEDAYFGVYCRRWGVPLIDGGTVRLPRIVGIGRALEIILTGRKIPSDECLRIGLCEYVVPNGTVREKAEELAREIARFPQVCVRADRRSAIRSDGRSVRDALIQEWYNGREALTKDGPAPPVSRTASAATAISGKSISVRGLPNVQIHGSSIRIDSTALNTPNAATRIHCVCWPVVAVHPSPGASPTRGWNAASPTRGWNAAGRRHARRSCRRGLSRPPSASSALATRRAMRLRCRRALPRLAVTMPIVDGIWQAQCEASPSHRSCD